MFPFHNRLKQRLKTENFTFREVENHKNNGRCIVFYFEHKPKTSFIREPKFKEYKGILFE